LAVLAQDIDDVARAGHAGLAAGMQQELARMRRQVDYHLAHARAVASTPSPGTRTVVAASLEGLVRTMRRLHPDRNLVIDVRLLGDPGTAVRVERQDLDEMLGNLLDNACKWARTRVDVSVTRVCSMLAISVNDDGPGLDRDKRVAVLSRGVRADDTTPGSGLGLAIVRDLAAVYDGAISLDRATIGGLSATLLLPPVHDAPEPSHDMPRHP
jgi:signal transduction histidine kinase